MTVITATKKPVTIQAFKLEANRRSIRGALEFMGDKVDTSLPIACDGFDFYCKGAISDGFLRIKTLESDGETQVASFGDYIIKGVKGEFYPCKPDIFEMTYDINKES